jgi:hypothetical protein
MNSDKAKGEKRKRKIENWDGSVCGVSARSGTKNYDSTPVGGNPAILQAALEMSWRWSAASSGASNPYASTIEI